MDFLYFRLSAAIITAAAIAAFTLFLIAMWRVASYIGRPVGRLLARPFTVYPLAVTGERR